MPFAVFTGTPVMEKLFQYQCRVHPCFRGLLGVQVVKAAADETPLTLAVLRDHVEKELIEEASLNLEAAAKV